MLQHTAVSDRGKYAICIMLDLRRPAKNSRAACSVELVAMMPGESGPEFLTSPIAKRPA